MRIILWELFRFSCHKMEILAVLNCFCLRSYGAGQRITNLKIYAILNLCKHRAPTGPPGLNVSNTGN